MQMLRREREDGETLRAFMDETNGRPSRRVSSVQEPKVGRQMSRRDRYRFTKFNKFTEIAGFYAFLLANPGVLSAPVLKRLIAAINAAKQLKLESL